MSSGLDIGPILDLAAGVLLSVLATGGTTVDLARPATGTTVDPDTAVATIPAATVLATGVPALVVPDAPGGQERIYPGAPEGQDARQRVILPPQYTDLRRGDRVTVTASRDARLVGGVFIVTVMLDNAAGAARVALARRLPERGQT